MLLGHIEYSKDKYCTEGKAKVRVVSAPWETEQLLAALAILHQDDFKKG